MIRLALAALALGIIIGSLLPRRVTRDDAWRESEDGVQPVDPRLAGEYGRLLAARDRLIADGADPADLLLPEQPL